MKISVSVLGCVQPLAIKAQSAAMSKLDDGNYAEKLTAILQQNDIKSVTVVRMEVSCCSGIESTAKTALKSCGKMIPWQVVTISTDGKILES